MTKLPALPRSLVTAIWVFPLICSAIIVVWGIAAHFLPWEIVYWREIGRGNEISANIASFQQHHGRLPNPEMSDEMLPLGFELRVDYYPYFRLVGTNRYELEYSHGFDGENLVYSSATGQWQCNFC